MSSDGSNQPGREGISSADDLFERFQATLEGSYAISRLSAGTLSARGGSSAVGESGSSSTAVTSPFASSHWRPGGIPASASASASGTASPSVHTSTAPTRAARRQSAPLPAIQLPSTHSPSISPRIHRASGSLSTMQHHSLTSSTPLGTGQVSPALSSFPRPAYLNHSYLRSFIHSERPPTSNTTQTQRNPLDRRSFSTSPQSTRREPLARNTSSQSIRTPSPEREEDEDLSIYGHLFSTRLPFRLGPKVQSVVISSEEQLQVPTRWNDQDRHNYLQVSADGRDLTFASPYGFATGSGHGEKEAAAIRANHPIPPACGVYYFEVEILNKGAKGHIGIGLGTKSVRLSRLPGWENESWGYHGDDGHVFAGEAPEAAYGPGFTTGDYIGCGINFSLKQMFYTKNGGFLGHVFKDINPSSPLYPLVGLRTSNESVRTNFGHLPFQFDINSYVQQTRNATWAKIMKSTRVEWSIDDSGVTLKAVGNDGTGGSDSNDKKADAPPTLPPIPKLVEDEVFDYNSILASPLTSMAGATPPTSAPSRPHYPPIRSSELKGDLREPIRELIFDYLLHNGYASTAEAFKEQSERERNDEYRQKKEIDEEEARKRELAMSTATAGSGKKQKGSTKSITTITDIKMEELSPPPPEPRRPLGGGRDDTDEARIRQGILNAVLTGDVDEAIAGLEEHYPIVLKEPSPGTDVTSNGVGGETLVAGGLMKFKLRCRKFVEMVLEASAVDLEQKQRDKANTQSKSNGTDGAMALDEDDELSVDDVDGDPPAQNGTTPATNGATVGNGFSKEEEAMDVDEDDDATAEDDDDYRSASTERPTSSRPLSLKQRQKSRAADASPSPSPSPSSSSLNGALVYGKSLHADYSADARPGVHAWYERTFSLVAYENPLDPREAGEDVVAFAGQEARDVLAEELNLAILESLGRRSESMLERVYRQTSGVVTQLGLIGEGQAAFADVEKEFLET
ncbi:hypothetical protein FRC02_007288 [Tulasnella sp. 418]|nr:hypothetical protein FRC02_007288 [Tulasnella sp. 418]